MVPLNSGERFKAILALLCFSVLNIDSCFTQSFANKDGGNQNQIQPYYYGQSLANCQTQCLEREDCESLTYYSVNDPTICVLYSVTLTVGELLDQPGRTYYNRNCPPGKWSQGTII